MHRDEIITMLIVKAVVDPNSVCAIISSGERRKKTARKEVFDYIEENYNDIILRGTVDAIKLRNGSSIMFINSRDSSRLRGLHFNSFIVDEFVSEEAEQIMRSMDRVGVTDE